MPKHRLRRRKEPSSSAATATAAADDSVEEEEEGKGEGVAPPAAKKGMWVDEAGAARIGTRALQDGDFLIHDDYG